MICPTCRRETPANRPFCEHCGALLPSVPEVPERQGLSFAGRSLVFGGLGLAALLCLGCAALIVVAEVPDLVALAFSTLFAIVPAVIYIVLVLWLDRYEHEPVRLLLFAFFWGAVVAVVLSYLVNSLVDIVFTSFVGPEAASVATAVITAPWVEELFKGIGLLILVLLFREEFDNALDGIVYGSMVGFGFAMTENIIYFGRQYAEGGLASLAGIVVLRAVLGGTGHALYTSTTGAAIGFARETKNGWLRFLVPIGGYLFAVGQHSAWNLIAGVLLPSALPAETADWVYFCLVGPIQTVVLTAPGTLTLAIVVFLTWRREASIIREELRPEVESGLIAPDDYAIMASSRLRLRSLWHTFRTRGLVGWYYRREYIQAATELAFRKWHLSRGETPKRGQKTTPDEVYRARIRDLQTRLA